MVALADLALLDHTVQRHVTVLAAGRVLIVGDVHGCSAELEELLRRHHRRGDTVILAGDVVNKGPDSVAALRRARTLDGCHALLGNHEIAALRGHAERGGGATPSAAPKYAWTDSLDASDVAWMRRLPFSIALPAHGALVVHAGLVPGVALDAQQPIDLVTMRNLAEAIDAGGGGPRFRACEKAEPGATAWAAEWRGPRHVYFGHDAKRGLQRTRHGSRHGLRLRCVGPLLFPASSSPQPYVFACAHMAARRTFCSCLYTCVILTTAQCHCFDSQAAR